MMLSGSRAEMLINQGLPPNLVEEALRLDCGVYLWVDEAGHLVLTNLIAEPIAWPVDDPPPTLPPDTVATLLDLARAGQEADFRWLAASAGVQAGEMEALWTGTRARVMA